MLKDPTGPLDNVRDTRRPITVRDLLTYRMGIGNTGYAGIPDSAPIAKALSRVQTGPAQTGDDYMKRLGELPLITEPGERFRDLASDRHDLDDWPDEQAEIQREGHEGADGHAARPSRPERAAALGVIYKRTIATGTRSLADDVALSLFL